MTFARRRQPVRLRRCSSRTGRTTAELHHNSYLSVGVPGTVAGLHLAWKDQGKLPWKRLVDPAVTPGAGWVRGLGRPRTLARRGPASDAEVPGVASRSSRRTGFHTRAGEVLKQPVLASTLQRIAKRARPASTKGETAELFEKEMLAHGGLITREDLKRYRAVRRTPIRGTYRGYDVIAMPPAEFGWRRARRDAEHPRGLRPGMRWVRARPRPCISWPNR